MKRAFIFILFGFLTLCSVLSAKAETNFNYISLRTAKDVEQLCTGEVTLQIQCLGVLQGAYEEIEYLQNALHSNYGTPLLFCVPPNVNIDGEGIKRAMSKYIELVHPKMDVGFAEFFTVMMRDTFPCSKDGKNK